MEEAKVTFRLEDSSSTTPATSPTTAQGGPSAEDVGKVIAADFQKLLSQLGGASSLAGKGSQPATVTAPSPPSPSSATAPQPSPAGAQGLLGTVQGIYTADPNVTAAELQKALGTTLAEATKLLSAARNVTSVPASAPVASPAASPTAPTRTEDLLNTPELRRVQEDSWIQSEQLRLGREQERERANRAANAQTPPPLSSDQQLTESERRTPPVQAQFRNQEEAEKANTVHPGVQRAANLIAGIAAQGGLVPSAVGNLGASAVANIPSVTALASGLGAAAPYLAVGVAAAGVPIAAGTAVINEAERARALIGNLSADVSQAEANARVRDIMSRIRTAQRLGDETGDYIENRSRISSSTQEIRDKISEPILQTLNSRLEDLSNILGIVNKVFGGQKEGQYTLANAITDGIANFFLGPAMPSEIKAWFRKQQEGENASIFHWFRAQKHLEPGPDSPFAGQVTDEIPVPGGLIGHMPGLPEYIPIH